MGNFWSTEGAGPLEGLRNLGWGAEDFDKICKSVIEEFEKLNINL